MNVFDVLFPKRTQTPKNRLRSRLQARRNRFSALDFGEQLESRALLAVAISPQGPDLFFIDTGQGRQLPCEYESFTVTSDTAYDDVWVRAQDFTGNVVGLANNEDGLYHIGAMTASGLGSTHNAYFYLAASSATNVAQAHVVQAFNGRPSANPLDPLPVGVTPIGPAPGVTRTYQSVVQTIEASSNKVLTVSYSPANPVLGGLLTMTVTGQLGQTNNENALLTPATRSDWSPDVYQLDSTVVTVTGTNAQTQTDNLYLTGLAQDNGNNPYTAQYTFRLTGVADATTPASPTQFVGGGKNWKHDKPLDVVLPPVPAVSNTLTLKKLVNGQETTQASPLLVPDTGTTVSFALVFTNSGTLDVSLDSIIDTLPVGMTYLNNFVGSAAYTKQGGVPVTLSAPTVAANGRTLTWFNPFPSKFVVEAGKTAQLTFQATMPAVADLYVNSSIGKIGSVQIDTTVITTDDVPADAYVECAELADLSISKTGPATYVPGQNLTYTITVTNLGPSTVTGATVSDVLPSGTGFVSATGGATYNAGTNTVNFTSGTLVPPAGSTSFQITVSTQSGLTGNLVNTATVSPPQGTTDPTPGNNSSTWTSTCTPVADLSISKTGPATYVPGQNLTYTITVTNLGPSTVTGATVSDVLPSGTGFVSATGGATYNAGTNTVNFTSGTLVPPAGSTSFQITVSTLSGLTGNLVNTATVSPPQGTTDPTPGNNSSTWTSTCTPVADLSISKTGPATYVPGQNLTYTITVTNLGPSTVTGATVSDVLPSGTGFVSATGGATYNAGTNTVNFTSGTLVPPAGSTSFQITVSTLSGLTGNLVNTATVSPPQGTTDPTPGNNSSTWTSTCTPVADLSISKTGPATYVPGQNLTYTITVTNLGPSTVTGATVSDVLPSGTGFVSATGGATYNAGTNTVNFTSGTLVPPAGSTSFQITVSTLSGLTGNLVNTATVSPPQGTTDPTPGNNSSTWTSTCTPVADLSISKTGPATYVPGQNLTYTITVTNLGPSTVTGATVSDILPSGTGFVSATGGATYNAGTNTVNFTSGTLVPPAGSTSFQITVSTQSGLTGNLVNTATVSPPSGTTDPTPGNNSSTWTSTCTPVADLSISKTGPATYVPGENLTYTITVTNLGPSTVTGATVSDVLPSGTGFVSATGGATYDAGTNTVNFTSGTLVPPAGSTSFQITVSTLSGLTGNLVNTATVSPPSGTTDPTPGNNSSTWTSTCTPVADLSISKTGPATYVPGQNLTYTITVTNLGPSTVTGATVSDVLPSGTGFVSATGGATYNAGTNTVNFTSGTLVPPAGSTSFQITVSTQSGLTGNLVNTATVSPPQGTTDPTPGNNSSTWTSTCTPVADLSISKTGPATYVPGENLTYTITVTNLGPSTVTGATVSDVLPSGTGFVSATGGATYDAGTNTVNFTSGTLVPPAGSTSFQITVSTLSGLTGNLVNTATVSPPSGTTDPTPGNNSSTWTSTCTPVADLSISKTGPATYVPGQNLTYTITVTNLGPSTVTGATVSDVLPSGTGFVSATGGATYNAGTNTVNFTSGTLVPPAGSTSFQITVSTLSGLTGNLVNTATVSPPQGTTDPTPGNNSSTWTSTIAAIADLSIVKTASVNPAIPGSSITYTLLVTNGGPSDVVGATVNDTFPGSITSVSWTTSVTGGAAVVPVGGTGSPLSAKVSIPKGDTVTFTVVCGIDPLATGTLTNTATVTPPDGTTDPTPDDNTSTVTVDLQPTADLGVVKTRTSAAPVVAGSPVTYSIVVTNGGPSSITSFTGTDLSAPGLLSPVYSVSTGSYDPGTGIWTAALGDSFDSGESVTFTLTGTVPAGATGSQVNTASVLPPSGVTDPDPSNNSSTVTDPITLVADLSVLKTGPATYVPGKQISYSFVVTNLGPSDVTGAAVTDDFAAVLSNVAWTVTYSAGGTESGTGAIVNKPVSLAVLGTATFTITADVSSAATGNLVNTASVEPPQGTTDPNPGNNTSTVTSEVVAVVDLSISKTDGTDTYKSGGTTTYTIILKNNGPSDVQNVSVVDVLPPEIDITTSTWFASYANASGDLPTVPTKGNISGLVSLSGSTGTVTITINANILTDPPPPLTKFGDMINTVTATPPEGSGKPVSATDINAYDGPINPTADIRALVVGSDDGCNGPPWVRVLDPETGFPIFQFLAYEKSFRGSVRVATGDVTGDGIPEIVVGPGRNRVGQIRVFTPNPLGSTNYTELVGYRTLPFGAAYRGGVEVTVGDVNGDGVGDIIAGQSSGAGLVRAFLCSPNDPVNLNLDGVANTPAFSFRAFPGPYSGGVMVAAGDFGTYLNGVKQFDTPDGIAEIAVGSNAGIRATVKVYDVSGAPTVVRTIQPFGPKFKGGVTLSVARYNADAVDDLFVGAGIGGNSAVEIYDGVTLANPVKLSAFASFAKPNARVFTAALDSIANPGIVGNIYGVKGLTGGGGAKGVRAFNVNTTQSSTLPQSTFLTPPLRIAPIIVRVAG